MVVYGLYNNKDISLKDLRIRLGLPKSSVSIIADQLINWVQLIEKYQRKIVEWLSYPLLVNSMKIRRYQIIMTK